MDWEKPLGAWEVTSMQRRRRSINWDEAVMKPGFVSLVLHLRKREGCGMSFRGVGWR